LSRTHARLDRSFVQAINDSHLTRVQLAALADYAAHDQLCRQLNADKVAITPLTTKRLRILADVIGHEGELFESERGRRRG
jgi:hypothetical protein